MMNKDGNKFWVFWGKLSAIAVTLVTLITLYFQIFPSKSHLVAQGSSFSEYSLPVDLIDRIKKIGEKITSDSLDKYISEYDLQKKSKIKSHIQYDFLYFLSKKIRGDYEMFFERPNYYHGFLYFVITNEGAKLSEDIYFSLPYNGIALLTEDNENQSYKEFNKEIKIKELRPKQSIKIAIWTRTNYYSYDEDKIIISDKDGVGSISMSLEVTGFAKFVARNLFLISFFTVIAFFSLIAFAWSIYPANKSLENKSDEIKETNERTDEDSNSKKAT